jgi:nucleoside phosphorylase
VEYYTEEMLTKHPFMRKRGFVHPGKSADQLFESEYVHVSGSSCLRCDAGNMIDRKPRLDDIPAIHYGVIASGNVVVKDARMRDEILSKHGAICLEMEAAGIMNLAPCIVIRGVSDYADSHKNSHWQPFSASTAAACAKELLEHIQTKALDNEPKAKDLLNEG